MHVYIVSYLHVYIPVVIEFLYDMFVDKSVEEVVQSEGVPHVRGREEKEEEVQKGRMKMID